jgi:hypothetical protein
MYDYNLISEWRTQGKSWGDIAKHYQRNRANVFRWFNRQTDSRAKVKEFKEPPSKPKSNGKPTTHTKHGKIVKYGRIDPTGFKSGLPFQEWRVKYAGRDPGWDLKYIQELEELYFNVINNYDSELPFVPRDYGKSFIGIDFVTYVILEMGLTTLVITSGGGSTRRFFNAVKRIIKHEKVRLDYGDILDYENKIDGELWLKIRQPNSIDADLRVVGRGADIIGSHPHLVFLEDFVQLPYKSQESEQGMRDWISYVVEPINAPITGTATRKDPDDIYGWMAEEGYTKLRVWPALTSEGNYPTRDDVVIRKAYHPKAKKITKRPMIREDFDLSGFEYLECPNHDLHSLLVRRLKNVRAFESEMMQRPIPAEGNYFSADNWKTFKIIPDGIRTIWVDPAFGASQGSSDTAIIVTMLHGGKLKVIDIHIGKYPKRKLIKKLNDVAKTHNTRFVKMENDYSQISTRWDMSDFNGLKIRYYYSSKLTKKVSNTLDAKLQRINDTDVAFENELIAFHHKATDIDILHSQYLRYDSNKGKWDALDVLASAYHSSKHKLISYNNRGLEIVTW